MLTFPKINVFHKQYILLVAQIILNIGLLNACSDPNASTALDLESGEVNCMSQVICQGQVAVRCASLPQEVRVDCGLTSEQCFTGVGCLACSPGERLCDGNHVVECSSDGRTKTMIESCLEGCARDTCINLCEEAALTSSYFGCEYWPTPMFNSVYKGFTFAVAVANPQSLPAEVSITRGGVPITQRSIAAGAVDIFELEWIEELSSLTTGIGSGLVADGAYRLTSSVPVTAYQFNPLEYELSRDCPESGYDDRNPSDNTCNSFSNDASLLLPTHTLGTRYLIMTYGSLGIVDNRDISNQVSTTPSSFQVVAVHAEPTELTIHFSSYTLASLDAQVSAYGPGEEGRFTLNQGDVLQIFNQNMSRCTNEVPGIRDNRHCGNDPLYDVSGTRVTSTKPIQVFGSHPCAFVPYMNFACDHLEESLFPIQSWGKISIVSATQSLNGEPNLIRVFSSSSDNLIQFTPNVHPTVTLNEGEWIEFETNQGFRVEGTKGIQVLQFLVGQIYGNIMPPDGQAFGDPAMSLVPPQDQFRTNYTFLTPASYATHYVSIVARVGQEVLLNGNQVQGFVEIPGTGWASAQVLIEAGSHSATSSESFGVWVYGFGSFTSYFYPGGLDLRPINDVTY